MTPINGKQLRNVIARGLEVRVVFTAFDPSDASINEKAAPERLGNCYFFAGMDADPDDFPDDAPVLDEGVDGTFGIYPVPGVNYD